MRGGPQVGFKHKKKTRPKPNPCEKFKPQKEKKTQNKDTKKT